MELSLFLAKLIGLYYLIFSFIFLFNRTQLTPLLKNLVKKPELIFFAGTISLAIGLAIVIGHPVYEWTWRGLITLFGFLAIISGLVRCISPSYPLFQKMMENPTYYWVMTAFLFFFGIYLTMIGFDYPP
ncbi:MAG: hypothetical protein ACSNEK_06295 [Parachlamydiaceae bacterium]